MFPRKIFGKSNALVTEEQAVQIAHTECKKQDWPWLEPIEVTSRFGNWIVRTNSMAIGASARIIINKKTGEVKKAGYLKR